MDSGGIGETFDPGVSGFLVGQGDLVAMAAAIGDLSSDPALRERMGEAGRGFIEEHFTTDRMVKGFEAVLLEAAATTHGARHRRAIQG